MAKLEILYYPDPRLRTKARPVDCVDNNIRTLIKDMFTTMYDAPGIGLAATQVNVHKQIVVIDISEDRSQPLALINPKIIFQQGEMDTEEGCLSVPGVYESVIRAQHIKLNTLDLEGKNKEIEAEGVLAVCIQHEVDHLQGKLFVDYLSRLKQSRIRKKLEKKAKQAG